MASAPMKPLAPRIYVAGERHLKSGIVVWLGPKRQKPFAHELPRWRRLHHRHVRILPLPAALIRRLWPGA